ncbi:hypothetical protein BHM03_00018614 [Ensete ventricosum]|uniref:Uncharacterized protein n=1 Tax=Ensete ventricosum TaxID=4639 RepID=A0A445MFE3_ENSVE|nr:hypothetical protein BHM03_00018614 [Ensete ventricosum]
MPVRAGDDVFPLLREAGLAVAVAVAVGRSRGFFRLICSKRVSGLIWPWIQARPDIIPLGCVSVVLARVEGTPPRRAVPFVASLRRRPPLGCFPRKYQRSPPSAIMAAEAAEERREPRTRPRSRLIVRLPGFLVPHSVLVRYSLRPSQSRSYVLFGC